MAARKKARPLPSKVYVVVSNAKSPDKARRVVYATWVRSYAYAFAKADRTLSVIAYEASQRQSKEREKE